MSPEIIDNVNKPSHYQGRYTRTAERLLSWECLEVSTAISKEKRS